MPPAPEPSEQEPPAVGPIAYYFCSGTLTRDQAHPLGQLLGDTLVRVPSASGLAASAPAIPGAGPARIETACFGGVLHHELQNHPEVYAWLPRCCQAAASPAVAPADFREPGQVSRGTV